MASIFHYPTLIEITLFEITLFIIAWYRVGFKLPFIALLTVVLSFGILTLILGDISSDELIKRSADLTFIAWTFYFAAFPEGTIYNFIRRVKI